MRRYSIFKSVVFSGFIFFVCCFLLLSQEELTYQMPPQEIAELVDAPRTPSVWISPDSKTLIILEFPGLPSIEELAQPELKLAGIRINPRTNGPSPGQAFYYNKMTFKDLNQMKEYPVTGLPENPKISNINWSPDAEKIAFLITRPGGIELWTARVKDGKAERLTEAIISAVGYWPSFQWLSDSKRILFKAVLENRGDPPQKDPVPKGPVVQSNVKKKKTAPVRTYQDLLKNKHDEELFVYYATSQQAIVDVERKRVTPIGPPGIVRGLSASPDGSYILVEMIKQPFSYLVPYYLFPQSVEIWDTNGKLVKKIADIPLAEDTPKGFDAVRKGPRSFGWRADAPAILYWTEAQDEGDPKKEVDIRDKLFFLAAPFTGKPVQGPALKYRYGGCYWGRGDMAMIMERWWKTRKRITHLFQPDSPAKPMEVIFDISTEDRYNDPGYFFTTPNQWGRYVLLTDKTGEYLYLRGRGASPQGNRPFIDKFELKTKKTSRLWRSNAPYYEMVVSVINIDKHRVLTRREGKKIQPNYYIRNLKSGKLKQITQFPHPFPKLKDVEKQLVKYKRADGVDLTGNLYLPPGYKKEDGPLPVLLWAYPIEFKSKYAAGQVTDSPYRFIYMSWWSPAKWVTMGYAVFDRVSMPIVGEGEEEPNDTYREQLVANAKAAIDKLAEMGIGDAKRVAVGGHSYGAFMVGNLLAHSRLFAAGIARSGAYNRTLTPFGFQREERTLWEALETYIAMSPFMHADKIKDPILLIHGEVDNNSGTFPIQSKRFYHALKGHGATARLILLPYESHGYDARESIMHVMWETYNWLEKYVKNKK
ncbi:MAG: prolyl oligopeptidase family serine peptidase [Candidatus Aminicenantes bacterium]|jgi:dipeptidyl aminopeptidase/acylaminoacyl peptidase